jgi:predicted metalloprotease with PDZ domain
MPPNNVVAAVLLASLVVACRSSGSAAETTKPWADLGYAFELASTDPPIVRARLSVDGHESGTSVFAVAPALGESGPVADVIHALRAASSRGEALVLEKLDERRWRVRAPAGTRIELVWELRPLPEGSTAEHGNEYRPIVRSDLFHTMGNNALVWPEWMEDGTEREIELRWSGFEAAGWTVACSHGIHQRLVRTRRSLPEFRHGVFLAGEGMRLHQRRLGDTVLCCALNGERWKFQDSEFVDLAERIVASERAFFQDPGPPFYLITLLPTPELPAGSFSLGGTALTDSFALYVMDGIGIEPGSDTRYRIARLLAHEHMHAWTGLTITPEDPEELCYWFTEGFTEFYTGRLLLAAGLISPEERIESLNEMLTSHWASPERNAPNERIREAFWSDPNIHRLPYTRGELVALRLDHEIRRATHGSRSLDDFLRELLELSRAAPAASGTEGPEEPRTAPRTLWTTETLLERAALWTTPALAEELRATIVDGEDLTLPANTWSQWLALEMRPSAKYALGFDRDATFSTGTVSGVLESSAPWEAGLRNGQRAVSFTATGQDPNTPVSLTIRDEQGEREVRWLPQGDALEVPAFRLVRAGKF